MSDTLRRSETPRAGGGAFAGGRRSTCARPSSAARTSSSTPTPCAGSCASPASTADDVVLEVGPGLGSLTLALLEVAGRVVAVELDADARRRCCPRRSPTYAPDQADRFEVVLADALRVDASCPARRRPRWSPTCPTTSRCRCCCTCSRCCPRCEHGLVMVQAEVADRLAAAPGSKVYGVPSVKAAWYADVRRAGAIGRNVFWPAPNVDSGLVAWTRREPPATTATPRAGLRGRRRRVRPAPQDAARRAQARWPAPARPPTPRWRAPASTRWRAASRWPSSEFARIAEALPSA